MKFTQSQVRALLQIGEETVRHWRKTLPPLQSFQGHGPIFALGDILALAVIAEILGLSDGKVSSLVHCAAELFRVCGEIAENVDKGTILLIDSRHVTRLSYNAPINPLPSPAVLVPTSQLLSKLRNKIHAQPEIDAQLQLPLA